MDVIIAVLAICYLAFLFVAKPKSTPIMLVFLSVNELASLVITMTTSTQLAIILFIANLVISSTSTFFYMAKDVPTRRSKEERSAAKAESKEKPNIMERLFK